MAEKHPADQPKADVPPSAVPRVIQAEALFQGDREVHIEHLGTCYRLRITRRSRLILQK